MRKDGYTPDMESYLIENYRKFPATHFAEKFGKTVNAILNKASKLKITKTVQESKNLLYSKSEAMADDYKKGLNLTKLQKKYCHSYEDIRRVLVEMGMTIKEKHAGTPKYKINASYFKHIDGPKKAYWLGFIWGDGNLCNGALQITVNKKDSELIYDFLNDIESNHKIYSDLKNPKICLKIKSLYQDLLNCGLYPNKSLRIGPPSNNIIKEDLIKYFILGLIDADGHFTLNLKKTKCNGVGLCGTESLMRWVGDYFTRIGLKVNIYPEKRLSHNLIWYISSSLSVKNDRLKIFRDHFYGDHNFGLKRKREKCFYESKI